MFRKRRFHNRTLRERFFRSMRISIKAGVAMMLPMPFVGFIYWAWLHYFQPKGWHLGHKTSSEVLVPGLIPTLCLLFGFLAATMLVTVWKEYKMIRSAVKRQDLETFIELRDEQISPLVHILMFIQAMSIILCFMIIDYEVPSEGLFCIALCSYLLAIYFVVVVEVDDPCHGLWHIRSIPESWLETDPAKYRQRYLKQNGKAIAGGADA